MAPIANDPCDLGFKSEVSHFEASFKAAMTESFAGVYARKAAVSAPAAVFAQPATSCWKNPTEPDATRIARSVKPTGGLSMFAFMAANIAGICRSRAVSERSRSAGGAKSRFMSRSTAFPGEPT